MRTRTPHARNGKKAGCGYARFAQPHARISGAPIHKKFSKNFLLGIRAKPRSFPALPAGAERKDGGIMFRSPRNRKLQTNKCLWVHEAIMVLAQGPVSAGPAAVAAKAAPSPAPSSRPSFSTALSRTLAEPRSSVSRYTGGVVEINAALDRLPPLLAKLGFEPKRKQDGEAGRGAIHVETGETPGWYDSEHYQDERRLWFRRTPESPETRPESLFVLTRIHPGNEQPSALVLDLHSACPDAHGRPFVLDEIHSALVP